MSKKKSLYNLSNQEAEKDSIILGSILAAAETSKKSLERSLPTTENKSSMCAVGAALKGVKKSSKISKITLDSIFDYQKVKRDFQILSKNMDVSANYIAGINDGFEGWTASRAFSARGVAKIDRTSLDYERGCHIGQTVAIIYGFPD